MLKHIFNFLRFSVGFKPITGPLRVHWDVTYLCNSRCKNCDRWKLPKNKDELTTEQAKNLIDQLKEANVKAISFSGNEPLMRKDILELIEYSKNKGFNISLNTNALLLNKQKAEELCKLKIDLVCFSIDGSNKEIHDNIRGVTGSFNQTFKALEYMQEAREKYNSKTELIANIVANHINISDLYKIVKLCKEKNIDKIHIQPIHNFNAFHSQDETNVGKEDLPILKDQLQRIQRDFYYKLPLMKDYYDKFLTFYTNPRKLYKYKCSAAYIITDIRANGDVVPCPIGFTKLGNIKEKSFKEIWFSEEAKKIRKQIRKNRHPICWFACAQPINLVAHYVKTVNLYRLLNLKFLKHIFSKLK